MSRRRALEFARAFLLTFEFLAGINDLGHVYIALKFWPQITENGTQILVVEE